MPLIYALAFSLMASPAAAERHTRYEKTPSKDVIAMADGYNPEAVIELGVRRERSSIESLKRIAADPDIAEPPGQRHLSHEERKKALRLEWRNLSHIEAKIALARIGEGPYFDEFVACLSSPDPFRRGSCIYYLADVGDKRAVKYLIPLLDDVKELPSRGKVGTPSIAMSADGALRILLPDVFAQFYKDSKTKGIVPIPMWKAWWSKNKSDYEK